MRSQAPSTSVDEGKEYKYDIQAEVPRGNGRGGDDDDRGKQEKIVYAVPLLPSWLKFDGKEKISGRPDADDARMVAAEMPTKLGRPWTVSTAWPGRTLTMGASITDRGTGRGPGRFRRGR